MKKRSWIVLCFSLMLVSLGALGQTVTKRLPSPVTGSTCPSIGIEYQVSVPTDFGGCQITWSAINGAAIQNQSDKTKVTMTWSDIPGAKGKVTATFSGCGNGNDGKTASLEELILSVNGQAWGSFGNLVNIDFCTPPQILVTVPRMFVPGTGGVAQPPLTEVVYSWTLPAGWKDIGSGNTGSVFTAVNFINIVPTQCAFPGVVKVVGIINDKCGSAKPSAAANITLNGVSPIVTAGPQQGYLGGTLCNTTPVTFFATTNFALGCISSYEWTFSSWTLVSQSGNSITLRPSGAATDQSIITAKVNFSCGSVISGSFTPAFTPPAISGDDLVCTTKQYVLQDSPNATPVWSTSNNVVLTINPTTGLASRVGGNGFVNVIATFSCTSPATVIAKSVWVGYPGQPGSVSGNTAPSVGGIYQYICSSPPQNAAYYNWTLPFYGNPVWSQSGGNINGIIDTLVPNLIVGSSSGWVQAFGVNECGNGAVSKLRVFPVAGGGGGGIQQIIAYPNPAQKDLTVEDISSSTNAPTIASAENTTQDFLATLFNDQNQEVKSGKSKKGKISFDLHDLRNGFYYLNIQRGEELSSQQIQIKK